MTWPRKTSPSLIAAPTSNRKPTLHGSGFVTSPHDSSPTGLEQTDPAIGVLSEEEVIPNPETAEPRTDQTDELDPKLACSQTPADSRIVEGQP